MLSILPGNHLKTTCLSVILHKPNKNSWRTCALENHSWREKILPAVVFTPCSHVPLRWCSNFCLEEDLRSASGQDGHSDAAEQRLRQSHDLPQPYSLTLPASPALRPILAWHSTWPCWAYIHRPHTSQKQMMTVVLSPQVFINQAISCVYLFNYVQTYIPHKIYLVFIY